MATSTTNWTGLPNEMKLAVISAFDETDAGDLKAIMTLAMVNTVTYMLCVPFIFKKINLQSDEAIHIFLAHVPSTYYQHIRELTLCNAPLQADLSQPDLQRGTSTDLARVLERCTGVQRLELKLTGSPSPEVISPFSSFSDLERLLITNCSREEQAPLSESVVVSIALAVPHLRDLTLSRISRSLAHATDLLGSPHVPLVSNDTDIPSHPDDIPLSLPSLLRIPTLRALRISETHLGDPRWEEETLLAKNLEMLELGSCVYESDDFNRLCAERILHRLGRTVSSFTLGIPLASATTSTLSVTALTPIHPHGGFFATLPVPPMQNLKTLRVAPHFPIDDLVSTLATTTLSASPIESLLVECAACDAEDVYEMIEEFIELREEQGAELFFERLKSIQVVDSKSGGVCRECLVLSLEIRAPTSQ